MAERWPYLLILTALVTAAALSLLLPGILGVSQGSAETWVMLGFLPVSATVVWALRKRDISTGTVTPDGNGQVDP
jgi:hypothetical protein